VKAEKYLTVKGCLKRIEQIKLAQDDDETAHNEEDNLMRDFVNAVASGMLDSREAQTIAGHIRTVNQMDFARWCA